MRCHHQWMRYRRGRYCVCCKRSQRGLRKEQVLRASTISLLLAFLLLLISPTKSDLQEAENLVRMKMIVASARYVSVTLAQEYTDYILKAARSYGMSPTLLLSLFITESELNHRARSSLGYKGISQIPQNVSTPQNIQMGASILREKMREAPSIETALGAYKGFGFVTNAHTRKVMRLKREIDTL
jgi:soluble lytic murein transglycosylase-like protein